MLISAELLKQPMKFLAWTSLREVLVPLASAVQVKNALRLQADMLLIYESTGSKKANAN